MAGVIQTILLFGELDRAAARAHHHADLAQFVARQRLRIEPRGLKRLARCRDCQRRHARNVRPVFRRDIIVFDEAFHFARDAHRQIGRVEARDRSHAAGAVPGGFPERFRSDSIGTDDT